MNIQELSSEIPLLNETIQAVEKVQEVTGKPMIFLWVDDMASFAKLKAARNFMKEHMVYLRKDQSLHINHMIVHECYHVYRYWSVDESQRKVLSFSSDGTKKTVQQWKNEMGSKGNQFPPAIWEMWVNGLMTLFYNAVTDTRIETKMYVDYPGLREEQAKSLKSMEQMIKQTLDKKIEQMTPSSLFRVSGAMNYVFLKQLEPIIGRNWRKSYKGFHDISLLGNRLLRVIPEKDEGLNQDIAILNKWAEILDFQGIRWNDFNDVPVDYIMQV